MCSQAVWEAMKNGGILTQHWLAGIHSEEDQFYEDCSMLRELADDGLQVHLEAHYPLNEKRGILQDEVKAVRIRLEGGCWCYKFGQGLEIAGEWSTGGCKQRRQLLQTFKGIWGCNARAYCGGGKRHWRVWCYENGDRYPQKHAHFLLHGNRAVSRGHALEPEIIFNRNYHLKIFTMSQQCECLSGLLSMFLSEPYCSCKVTSESMISKFCCLRSFGQCRLVSAYSHEAIILRRVVKPRGPYAEIRQTTSSDVELYSLMLEMGHHYNGVYSASATKDEMTRKNKDKEEGEYPSRLMKSCTVRK